jgi:hypothetical protein
LTPPKTKVNETTNINDDSDHIDNEANADQGNEDVRRK